MNEQVTKEYPPVPMDGKVFVNTAGEGRNVAFVLSDGSRVSLAKIWCASLGANASAFDPIRRAVASAAVNLWSARIDKESEFRSRWEDIARSDKTLSTALNSNAEYLARMLMDAKAQLPLQESDEYLRPLVEFYQAETKRKEVPLATMFSWFLGRAKEVKELKKQVKTLKSENTKKKATGEAVEELP